MMPEGIRKGACIFMTVILFLPLCACWDYRGLNELSIVTGIAIDEDEKNKNNFLVSLEIMAYNQNGKIDELDFSIVESSGQTINEAIKKTAQNLKTHLSFSHVNIIIFSHKLLESNNAILNILDPFIRDSEVRDSMLTVVSRDDTAKELLGSPDSKEEIVSLEINRSLMSARGNNEAEEALELYKVYDILSNDLQDLMLPAVRKNPDFKGQFIVDSAALFRGSEFIGFIGNEDLIYYRLAMSDINEGHLPLLLDEEKYISLTVRHSKNNKIFTYDGEKFYLTINIDIPSASAVEFADFTGEIKIQDLKELEKKASEALTLKMEKMLVHMQRDQKADTLGFAKTIYRNNPFLWDKVSKTWDELYLNAEMTANCTITILDSEMQSRAVSK